MAVCVCLCVCVRVSVYICGGLVGCMLYLNIFRRLCGEKAADEKQKTPNGFSDGKQQTTESSYFYVAM